VHVIATAAVSLFLTQASQSVSFGQTASPLGSGNAEVAMTPGFGYSSMTQPSVDGTPDDAKQVDNSIVVPAIEGNFAYGLSDTMNLNIHGAHSRIGNTSGTAIQPGVKINLMRGGFDLAVLPQIGFSYGTMTSEVNNAETTSSGPGLLAGAKILASHAMGVYYGLGYDFSYQALTTEVTGGETELTNTGHNVNVGLGYNWQMGNFNIRPEIAFLYSITNATASAGGAEQDFVDGNGWMVFPNISFAVGSGSPPATATASR
jgi:hypothetical protein